VRKLSPGRGRAMSILRMCPNSHLRVIGPVHLFTVTHFALSRAILTNIAILLIHRMASFAYASVVSKNVWCSASQYIHTMRDSLKMVRIHTELVMAQMINVGSWWYRTFIDLITHAVRSKRTPGRIITVDDAIAFPITTARPFPTPCLSDNETLMKALFHRSWIVLRHTCTSAIKWYGYYITSKESVCQY